MGVENQTQASSQVAQQLVDFVSHLQGQFERKKAIKEAMDLCKPMMDARAVAVYLVNPSAENEPAILRMAGSLGYDRVSDGVDKRDQDKFVYELVDGSKCGLTATIALSNTPVRVNNRGEFASKDGYFGRYDKLLWKNPTTCQSFVGVPLTFADECIGVLKVESDKEDAYTDQDEQHIQILGLMLAAAVNQCQFLEQLARSTKGLANSRSDVEIFQKVVRDCAALSRAEACSLFLYDEELQGLVMRADHGHDHNLSNASGPDSASREYIYDGSDNPPGLTWLCYSERKPQSKKCRSELESSDSHASRIWKHQWNDSDKKLCHSVYLHPVYEEGTTNQYGVLKVENKLSLDGIPKETGGFAPQDEFVVKLFADAVALLCRDNVGLFGQSYKPAEIFGQPVLACICEDKGFERNLRSFTHGPGIFKVLHDFAERFRARDSDALALAEYCTEVNKCAIEIAKVFHDNVLSQTVSILADFRDHETLLNRMPKYRHHFVHQFNVFVLGLTILSKVDTIRTHLISKVGKRSIMREWFLASMFHDVGMPVERLNEVVGLFLQQTLHLKAAPSVHNHIFSPLSTVTYYDSYRAIDDRIAELLGCLSTQEAMHTVLHSFASHGDVAHRSGNHPLISAAIMEQRLRGTKLDERSKSRIISAILLHDRHILHAFLSDLSATDRESADKLISSSTSPLTFLLALCDIIQNWGRPEQSGELSSLVSKKLAPVTLRRLNLDALRVEVYLRYPVKHPNKPENWDAIVTDVLKPQRELWRNDIKDLSIRVIFEGDDGIQFDSFDFPIKPRGME